MQRSAGTRWCRSSETGTHELHPGRYTRSVHGLEGFLIDIDGVVRTAKGLVPGSAETVSWLRERGIPFRFLTNTSRMSQRAIAAALVELGLPVAREEIVSTSVVAAEWLRMQGYERLHLLVAEDTREDFAELELTEEAPDAVVVGDMGRHWSFDVLNRGFVSLRAGARLVALQKGRAWETAEGWAMDAGAFVVALEYAAECEATVIGKPARSYFETALAGLGVPAERTAMIGDDPETDIRGGREAGLSTILVRTGKYRGGALDVEPDDILQSIAELPEALSGTSR